MTALALLDFLFPRTCAACGKRLNDGEQAVCSGCMRHLHRVPYSGNESHGEIERLFWGRLPIERATSLFYYDSEAAHSLLHHLKYYGRPEVGTRMGQLIVKELAPKGFFEGIDVVVPLPLHWRRFLRRGYNQSAYLTRGIHRATGLPIEAGGVRRVRNNPSQTAMPASAARRQNVEGIFRLTPRGAAAFCGKHVLLIDDTLTTGATLTSCGQEIARVAKRLSVCTLAYAGQLVHQHFGYTEFQA